MHIKKWISIVIVIGVLAIAFVWMKGVSQTTDRDISILYVSSSVPAPGPGEKKVVLKNLGMTWVLCTAAVAAKLKQLPGIIAYDVDLKSDSVTILYDPTKVSIEGLKQAVAQAGFQVRGMEEIAK